MIIRKRIETRFIWLSDKFRTNGNFGTSIENFDDNYTSNNNDVNGSTNNGTSGNISPSKLKDKVRSINCITISSDKNYWPLEKLVINQEY